MGNAAGVEAPAGPLRSRVLQPGRTCWRIAEATRASVLVDGAVYFAALETALRKARRSIVIVGWDFDGRIRLRPDEDPDTSPPLGPFLAELADRRLELEINILVWSVAVVHAPGAATPLILGADWQEHPRVTLRLDTAHPIYGAHHQKIVCIDEQVAFVGGMDLTVRRWDTREHASARDDRTDPDGAGYGPVHDIQMVVDGPAAQAVSELVRRRWGVATGETIPSPDDADGDPWPDGLEPDFRSIPVGIARTMPPRGRARAVTESAELTAAALEAAERTVYIEAQYFTAPFVGDILARHLKRPGGPEIVVLTTHRLNGVVEGLVMGVNRDRMVRRLKAVDHEDRLRVYHPHVPVVGDGGTQVLIHSKLIVVDDVFLRVGSSNLNNRSIALDTECDLALEASSEEDRETILRIRDGLIAEHIHRSVAEVRAAIGEAGGSIVMALERLNGGPRGLKPFKAATIPGASRPVFGTALLDPAAPFLSGWTPWRGGRRRP